MNYSDKGFPTIGNRAQRAIELECTAIKAGNVHPYASFADVSYSDFLGAAHAIGIQIDLSRDHSVGRLILNCVTGMMQSVRTNTSLGTILLIVPLAKAVIERKECSRDLFANDVDRVLHSMHAQDSIDIYRAIAISNPGGLGQSETHDINQCPPHSLLEAMQFASEWDDVALQFVTKYSLVFEIADRIANKVEQKLSLLDGIRCVQIELLSERVDSLISRKVGIEQAREVQSIAKRVIDSGEYGSPEYENAWQHFDNVLRDPKHRNNPGTTADMLAAALFVLNS